MRKSLVFIFLISTALNSGFASEIVLTFEMENNHLKGGSTNQDIYNKFVTKTGLHKERSDNYHVTVGWIKNIDPQDKDSLNKHMRNKLNSYKHKHTFVFDHAGRYLVNRTPDRCPIVLFPDDETTNNLKKINVDLSTHLKNYKSVSGNKYSFIDDIMPGTYTPHVTLANSKHIEAMKVDRDESIKKINGKLRNFKNKFGVYKVVMK